MCLWRRGVVGSGGHDHVLLEEESQTRHARNTSVIRAVQMRARFGKVSGGGRPAAGPEGCGGGGR